MSSTKITEHDLDEALVNKLLNSDICLIRHDDTGQLFRIGIDSNGIYTVPYTPDGGES